MLASRIIHISELKSYIDEAFSNDFELLKYFDKKEKIDELSDAYSSIFEKIKSIDNKTIVGVYMGADKVGYFVYDGTLLISFGINKWHRMNVTLVNFWDCIKSYIGDEINCALYSYNIRAIKWLQKCGMKVVSENITLLKL